MELVGLFSGFYMVFTLILHITRMFTQIDVSVRELNSLHFIVFLFQPCLTAFFSFSLTLVSVLGCVWDSSTISDVSDQLDDSTFDVNFVWLLVSTFDSLVESFFSGV